MDSPKNPNNTHYTCTECRSEANQPGVCQDPDCLRHGQELISCECRDGEHGGENEESYYAR
jgi:hypothetical protein